MSEHDTSIMIAFLPLEASWVKQDLPHLTLVFGGEISDRTDQDFKEMMADMVIAATLMPRFSLLSLGVEQFGEGVEQVDVLRFVPTTPLLAVHRVVERWSKSQYMSYNPHVTIGPVGTANSVELPFRVHFDRILLAWGDKHYTCYLRNLGESY